MKLYSLLITTVMVTSSTSFADNRGECFSGINQVFSAALQQGLEEGKTRQLFNNELGSGVSNGDGELSSAMTAQLQLQQEASKKALDAVRDARHLCR
ncbi:MAG: hypothetical protein ACK5WZ_08370 [Pseudobdellovibrionaceae bacterium]|jgi:hypothetical protein